MANVVNITDTITVQAGAAISKVLTAPNDVTGYNVTKNDVGPGGTATSVTTSLDWGQTGTGYTLKYKPKVTFGGVAPASAGTYHKTYNCQTKSGSNVLQDFKFDLTIVVTGSTTTYTIVASAGSNGSISPSGNVSVDEGESKTFTITPNANYYVNSVKVDNVEQGSIMEYTFNSVTANHTISATFGRAETITATDSITVGPGGSISKVVIVDEQHLLYGLTKAEDGASGNAPNVTTTLNWNQGGMYCRPQTTFGGTAPTAAGSYTKSYTCRLVASGFTVKTFIMTLNITVLPEYTITASAGSGGSIAPSGSVKKLKGENQTFTFTPNAGYEIDAIKVDGTTVTKASTYTFSNITANHTINVTFKILTFTVSASAGTGGTISPSGSVTKNYGESQSYTFTPSEGYEVASITLDGTTTAYSSTSYTLSDIHANHVLSVQFAKIKFTIVATAGANGTINPSGNVEVEYGDSQTFTITPLEGFFVEEVLVDGEPVEIED